MVFSHEPIILFGILTPPNNELTERKEDIYTSILIVNYDNTKNSSFQST